MHNFPRPATPTVAVEKKQISGYCPECHSEDIAAYRVLSEGGWWEVEKCQSCLHSLNRKPGPLLGAIVPLGMDL